jgi:hypothetical protein
MLDTLSRTKTKTQTIILPPPGGCWWY